MEFAGPPLLRAISKHNFETISKPISKQFRNRFEIGFEISSSGIGWEINSILLLLLVLLVLPLVELAYHHARPPT